MSADRDPVRSAFAAIGDIQPSPDLAPRIKTAVGTTTRRSAARARWIVGLAAAVAVAVGLTWVGLRAAPGPATSTPSPVATDPSAPPSDASTSDLGPGAIAWVTQDFSVGTSLEIRSGQSVFVIAGPVDHDGRTSLLIQHYGDVSTEYQPDGNVAWITLAKAAEVLVRRDPICPTEVTLSDVANREPFERLACFGNRELTFEPVAARDLAMGAKTSRRWISSDGRPDWYTGLPVYGLTAATAMSDEGWFRVTGHFDDPTSAGCGDAAEIAWCRERFFVTAVTAVDPPGAIVRGTWTTMADAPIDGRTDHVLIWTGTDMLVWGGTASRDAPGHSVFDGVLPRDGAGYDPAADRWRRIPAAPIGGRNRPIAVWTGEEMVVFGGQIGADQTVLDGAAYDPGSNRWRTLSKSPLRGTGTIGGWVAGRLIVVTSISAAAYEPSTDRWTSLPDPPIQAAWASAAITVDRLTIVDFGDGATPPVRWATFDPATSTWIHGIAPIDPLNAGITLSATNERVVFPETGDEFDPAVGRWDRTFRCEGAGAAPVWTGSVLIAATVVWDDRTQACRHLPPSPPRAAPFDDTNGREFPVAVWTGGRYLTWSGGTGGDIVWVPNDGAIFTPDDDLGPCCG